MAVITGKTATPKGPGWTVSFSTDLTGTINWTASAGTASFTGKPFVWSAPNTAQTVRITASNGTTTLIWDILVVSREMGYKPSKRIKGRYVDKSLIHIMENGARRGRRKVRAKMAYEFSFQNRTYTEYTEQRALYDELGTLAPFLMWDPIDPTGQTWTAYYFDSEIVVESGGRNCAIDYSVRLMEA